MVKIQKEINKFMNAEKKSAQGKKRGSNVGMTPNYNCNLSNLTTSTPEK